VSSFCEGTNAPVVPLPGPHSADWRRGRGRVVSTRGSEQPGSRRFQPVRGYSFGAIVG